MPFPITCTACQKTFSIADDVYERKVKGRVVTIKCKQCQAGIRVDGTQGALVASASDSVRPTAASITSEVAEAPAAAVAPSPTIAAEKAAIAPAATAPAAAPVATTAAASKAATAPGAAASKAATAAPATSKAGTPPTAAAATAATSKAATTPAATGAATSKAAIVPKAAVAPTAAAPRTPLAGAAAAPRAPLAGAGAKAAPTAATAPRAPLAGAAKAPLPAATKAPLATVPRAQAAAPNANAAATRAAAGGVTPKAPAVAASAVATPIAAVPVAPAPPPAPVAAPVPSPAATEVLWAVDYPDGQDRELTLAEIAKELASGAISQSSLVWREGMDEWLELAQVADLQALLAAPKPAPLPEVPAQRPKAPSAPGIDLPKVGTLPKARPTAPSAPDFALHEAISSAPPPRMAIPRAPTMAGIGLPTPPAAPAPELLVALPAFAAPPPAFAAAPPAFAAALTFPTAAPAGPTAPAFPAASALPREPVMVPAPALAAPFAATVQPFGRPAAPPVGATAPTGGIPDWPQKRNRTPLIIGALVVLALGAGIFFATRASDDKLPPPTPISALPAAAPTSRPASATPPAAAPTAAATVDNPAATGASPGSGAALQPPGGAPTATPNAGFAELFASSARRADEKKGASGQRFDQNAAKAALAAAAFETAKCREKGGPTGKATIVVTFEPSGKVASATVSDPPFAGTSSGACIAAAMKRASVPAFSGLPGTVTKIISIQ